LPVSFALAAISIRAGLAVGAALFGLGAMWLAWQLARPKVLTLEPAGMSVSRSLRRRIRIAWADIGADGFFVYRRVRGGTEIGFNYRVGAVPEISRLGKLLGAESPLSGQWPLSVEQMVDELNFYRRRALSASRDS
jgi:hypothetical protein